MMKRTMLALGLVAAMAANSGAVCTAVGTSPVLLIPNFGDSGAVWAPCLKYDLQVFASSGAWSSATSLISAQTIWVKKVSGLGQPIEISSPTWHDAGTYDRNLGSATVEGALGLGVTYGVTAATFTGNGAALTALTAANISAGTATGLNTTGNAATATALAATPTTAASGYVALGVAASGNVVAAHVATSGISSSTEPVTSGALFTHAALTGTSAHGAASANTASAIVARDAAGNFTAGTITAQYGVAAATGNFTATGATQYSITTSSGINIAAGGVKWPDGTISTTATTSGGGGLSSMQLASGTVSGGNIGTAAGGLQSATSIYLDSAGMSLTMSGNAAIIQVKNLTFVSSTMTYPSGTTTASALGACIANSTATWTQGNNKTQICYAGSGQTGSANNASAGVLIDGAFIQGFDKGVQCSPTSNGVNCSFCTLTTVALSAGQHTACLTAATSGGTFTIPASASPGSSSVLTINELATGGAGYSAPASSQTVVPAASITVTALAQCVPGSTITYTSSGADADVTFNGAGAVSGIDSMLTGYLFDGALVPGETATQGFGAGSSAGGGYDVNLSFKNRQSGISAGSHSLCLLSSVQGGTGSLGGTTWTTRMTFEVREIRTTAGGGDVSSNGTNNLSGSFTATGPVHLSTGGVVDFATGATWSGTTTSSFVSGNTVTGSTISFVVQGSTVECYYNGGVYASAGSNQGYISFGVDGSVSKVTNTSATVAITSWITNSGGAANPFPVHAYRKFQVAAGVSHAFFLGVWGSGVTMSLPGTNSTGQFGCDEVPSR